MPRHPRYLRSSFTPNRSGAILLVVLVLLALFAVVGLTFVYVSGDAATSARIYREGQSDLGDLRPDPTVAATGFLGQLVYPVGDTGRDTTTALRGHDLARLIYGANPGGNNTTPYNGVGLFHEPLSLPGVGILDRAEVINFTYRPDPLVPANAALVDPERSTGGIPIRTGPTAPFVSVPGIYVGKNASYTYPDRNNLAVGVADPSTGQVVVPSFHRPTLFGRLDPPIPGVLRPNPNWTNSRGRFKILRPRPADHVLFPGDVSQFPYPPPNADGSFTGDVQNLWGGVGVQRNDSVWLDANLGVVTWRGRRITPLIAPLVLPLDGRVNLNVAGNLRNSGSHASNMGFGPYEVSLVPVFPRTHSGDPSPAAAALVRTRYRGLTTPSPRGATTIARVFHPDPAAPQFPGRQTLPPESARVDWDGAGQGLPVRLPGAGTGAQFGSTPMWPAGQFDNSDFLPANRTRPTATGEAAYHPGFFVPYQWDRLQFGVQSPTARLFPISDLGWFGPKYSGAPEEFTYQTYLGRPGTVFASLFNGSGPKTPANAVRMLVTPVSNSLRRPGLAPNFFGDASAYELTGSETVPTLSPSAPILDLAAVATGAAKGSDVGTPSAGVRNRFAAVASVDLNRPLTDYRTDRLKPLGPTNLKNFHAAWRDRQALAADILAALVIATGASTDTETRRWLAQVAVNMVDAIDDDDISTPFVWNPINTKDPLAAANFDPAELPNRVVFGVEKPRLILNEGYAEVANDPADRTAQQATHDFQVRFFVELLNPGGAETDSSNPLYYDSNAPGSVPLRYRAQGFSAYRVAVYTNGTDVRRDLSAHRQANVTGLVSSISPKLLCDFLGVGVLDPLHGPWLADRVEPNSGRYTARFPSRHGFAVIGPTLNPATADSVAFVPDPKTDPRFRLILQKPADLTAGTNQLYYTWPSAGVNQADIVPDVLTPLNATDHALVLQRLACPYAPPGATNPYITVDYMTGVRIQDAIRVAADGPRSPPPPATSRSSIGRIQPLAAAGDPTLTYPRTLVLKQQNLDSMGQPSGIQASFFRHNSITANPPVVPVAPGPDTLLAPFEWLVHLDRRVVNACELFHVAAVKPHELTHQFAVPQADGPPLFHRHDLQHLATGNDPAGAMFAAGSSFHRTLELLAVKPWLHGVPEGGRVPGKVNLNMVWDQRVFNAVLDPQPANRFSSADVDVIWQGLTATRTPGFPGQVGATYDEVGTGGDRPLKSLGSPVFQPGGGNRVSTGLDDTILRSRPSDGLPLFQRPESSPSTPLHPYLAWEPLRKAFNNVTTVTDTYLVVMTVGYFEVRGGDPADPNNPIVLGAEVSDILPGDLRTQFVAVVDRTNLVAQFASPGDETPWLGELQQSIGPAAAGAVVPIQVVVAADTPPAYTGDASGGTQRVKLTGFYNGFPWVLEATYDPDSQTSKGTPFFLGVGGKQDLVEAYFDPTTPVTNWQFDPVNGVVTLPVRVGAGGLGVHRGGEAVGNAVFGNPGPQPKFDQLARRYRPVVPFFRRVSR